MKLINISKNIHYMMENIEDKKYITMNIFYSCMKIFKDSVLIVLFVQILFKMIELKLDFKDIIIYIIGMGVIFVLISLFTVYFEEYYKPTKIPMLQKKLLLKLYQKSIDAEIENFDNPKFYNDYIWTMQQLGEGCIKIVDDLSNCISNLIISFSVLGLLSNINHIVLWTVMLSVVITAFIYSFIIKINFNKDVESNYYIRKRDYFKRVFYLKDYAKEIRISGISSLLLNKFKQNEINLVEVIYKYGEKLQKINFINGITISILLDIGLIVLLCFELFVSKKIGLGDFIASTYAIWSLFYSLNNLISGWNRFPEHSLRIEKMKKFMMAESVDIKKDAFTDDNVKINSITLKNISFSYDKNGKEILKNVNMEIYKGEKIAIVGKNGSGKTTLIKIILGLYKPQSGEILYNKKSLGAFNIKECWKNFGTVFQDFRVFAASLGENVALDLSYDCELVKNALNKSLFYNSERQKKLSLETIITKEFDENGIVLSGGQIQKLAISRAFLNKDFVVMDEPSAMLDVDSEITFNKMILNGFDNSAICIVSHRLSSTINADKIIVLSKGEIVEQGSHQQLMANNGLYAKMFNIQSKQFVKGEI